MDWRYDPSRTGRWALFLDVDGTLLEIADSPAAVEVPSTLKETLAATAARESGALALVSGRSLAQLDALFSPYRFAAAGLHGIERRSADGGIERLAVDPLRLDAARAALSDLAARHPGLLFEDKGLALALHFRRAPQWAELAWDAASLWIRSLGPDFQLQPGKCVVEIKPAGLSKRTAIESFLDEPPFAGRIPVFLGDDVTDEDGFAAVNERGGCSIQVGRLEPTAARHRLPGVGAVADWLSGRASLGESA